MKNQHAAYIAQQQRTFFSAGMQTGAQAMYDAFCIALNDNEHLGEKRLTDLLPAISSNYESICDAFNAGDDKDYQMECIDRRMRSIFPNNFIPYATRYDFVKMPK